MRVLQTATLIEANRENFNTVPRPTQNIAYIVMHYTSNKNDTARNNALYFRDEVTKSSAHYFVSGKSIYQSVPDHYSAYAVGLGSMKEPYFKWPLMWGKIYNSNSISIEICGSKNSSEADDETKRTAAKLAADLIEKYGLNIYCLYRHYDVTGKPCPLWAVSDANKWNDFKVMVNRYLQGKEDDDNMINNDENYIVFKQFMERYQAEQSKIPAGTMQGAMDYCKANGLMNDGRAGSPVLRAELATVLQRMGASAK